MNLKRNLTFLKLAANYSSISGSECSLDKMANGISIISLNRPKQRNALGSVLLEELNSNIDQLRRDEGTRVVIIRSLVPKIFCAGADLKERASMSQIQVDEFVHKLRRTFDAVADMPTPTIACIDGFALGGGLELALGADMRIGGQDANVGLPETGLAIIPGAGGTQRLPRLIGVAKAKELIFTGQILNSEQALSVGILNKITSGPSFPEAMKMAEALLLKGPLALRMAKLAIDRGSQIDLANGLAFEKTCYAQIIPSNDRLEGLMAFREKRTPVYTGK